MKLDLGGLGNRHLAGLTRSTRSDFVEAAESGREDAGHDEPDSLHQERLR